MDINKDKELDAFVKKAVKEVGLGQPSVTFTDMVLSKVQMVNGESPITRYKPLISKKTWWIIAALVIGVFVFVVFDSTRMEISWLSTSRLDWLSEYNIIDTLSGISISNTFVYGFLALTFFVYVQIILLKHYLNSRYALH